MKKEIIIKCIITLLFCSLMVAIGFFANQAYHKYPKGNFVLISSEENYVKSLSTRDLIEICDKYIKTNDLSYLDYIDDLLAAENYEQEVLEYYKNDAEFLHYALYYGCKDTHLISTMYICAVNNDVDKFIAAMEKYYPQMTAGKRGICFNNTMLKIKSDFIKSNIDVITDIMHSFSFETDNPIFKILELSNILTAYKVVNENDPKIKEIEKEIETVYDEYQLTDKNGIKEIQKEQMENYIYCWTDMMKEHDSDSDSTAYSYKDR